MPWTRSSGGDQSTRSARVIRRSALLLFVVLALLWTSNLTLLDLLFVHSTGLSFTIAIAGVGAFGVVTMGWLRRVLHQVDVLDGERHGLREAYDRARLDSLRDGLTGLGNHRAFQEELEEQAALSKVSRRPFTLLFIDVDDLKKVNDTRGHGAGDHLLRATARIIAASLRRSDRGFRIGGDEFAVILVDCGPQDGLAIGRRILAAALNAGDGTLGIQPFSLTIGVSSLPTLAAERQQLLHQADAALYWGKRHGRTDVRLFDPSVHGMADDWRPLHELAAAVARVAAERLLSPVYQPIYSLVTGEVLGYEGLVRPAPESTFPNAGALFVAAESTGHTVELDVASLETVLAGAGSLDPSMYLSVNLSPRTLEADAFSPQELLSMASRRGIEPGRLVVELTEREAVEDLDRLRTALAVLRRHGVRIAADDVGAGNAGLRLLSELTFDVMKIDLSLVRAGVETDPSGAVLRALRELARGRGQTIVAEGVETTAHLESVRSLGFDAGQGYLLKRPAPQLDAVTLNLERLSARPDEPAPLTSLWAATVR